MLPISLRIHRLLNPPPDATPQPGNTRPRPDGRLVWLHAGAGNGGGALPPLVRALLEGSPCDAVLVTMPGGPALRDAICVPPPADTPESATAFLDHWRPDACIWLDDPLMPVLLHVAGGRGLAMMLADAREPQVRGQHVWPGVLRQALAGFRHVLVRNAEAERMFVKAGVAAARVRVTGLLERQSPALAINEAERVAMARAIGTRPVWLAAAVPEAEDDAIAAAHLSAMRLAHRLLMIVVPDDPQRGTELADRLRRQYGLDTVCRSRDEEPVEEAQAYIADTEGEIGLWYRLAPVTYLGGTLLGSGPLRRPSEAAAMGSAILHGLADGGSAPEIAQLREAGASRVVPSAADLGDAVGDLLAPDRCARLARAAWATFSAGAEATAQTVALVNALLHEARA